jgi:methanogenic corrinoid protein MtbC1
MVSSSKSTCKALANHTAETLLTKFDDLTTGDIETTEVDNLADDQIRHILDNKALIEDFLKAIESKVFEDLNSGKEFEGYKLVAGRSISKWIDTAESSLKELLNDEDKLYKKSLITITEAKKLLDKDVIASLTYKPEGKPTLAKSSDKRKSINILKFS